jgi:hypothetical protein
MKERISICSTAEAFKLTKFWIVSPLRPVRSGQVYFSADESVTCGDLAYAGLEANGALDDGILESRLVSSGKTADLIRSLQI